MPELLQPNYTKLDLPKLQADVSSKYIKAGVPQDKLYFWNEIGVDLKSIEEKSLYHTSSRAVGAFQAKSTKIHFKGCWKFHRAST